jgi:CheY-like chemotaxis protein
VPATGVPGTQAAGPIDPRAADPRAADPRAADPGACTILLVDDEEANLDLLGAVLRPRGYRNLVRVSDAREAAAAFEAARPDLVLLDLHMPHRSGFEVLADLAARIPEGEFLPVLVLTADVTPQARERALAGGAHDFVLKPFDRTEVLLRVRNLLHARRLHLAQRHAREAAERAAARARLLADVTRLLALSFDTATALGALAQRLVPEWADACAVTLDGGGFAAAGPSTFTPALTSALADAGTDAGTDADAAGGLTSDVLRAPLAREGGAAPAGLLAAARGPDRSPFDADDHALAAELARRAALAVENAASTTPPRRRSRRATGCWPWSRTTCAARSPPSGSTSRCWAPSRRGRSPRPTRARSRGWGARRRAWTRSSRICSTRRASAATRSRSTAVRTTPARSSPRRPTRSARWSRARGSTSRPAARRRSPSSWSTPGGCCRRSPTWWATPRSSPRTAAA